MPKLVRTIKLYTCDFKCGTKAKEKYKILSHEEKCFCNPANRSCRICQNCESSSTRMTCNKLKLYILNLEKPHKVYDFDNNIAWEIKPFPESPLVFSNKKEYEEIDEHNTNPPFPIKNCPHFILGKKIF